MTKRKGYRRISIFSMGLLDLSQGEEGGFGTDGGLREPCFVRPGLPVAWWPVGAVLVGGRTRGARGID